MAIIKGRLLSENPVTAPAGEQPAVHVKPGLIGDVTSMVRSAWKDVPEQVGPGAAFVR